MTARTWWLAAFLSALAGVGLLLTQGCEKKSTNANAPANFSIQFDYFSPEDQTIWVILHDLAGDTALEIRSVNADGLADFGDVQMTRVSCSIVYWWDSTSYDIQSFLNVPGGAWRVHSDYSQYEALGRAELALNYPPGQYDWLVVAQPGGEMGTSQVPATGQFSQSQPVHALDGDRFSAYAMVYNEDHTGLCGALTQQPFQLYDTNRYAMPLETPLTSYTFLTSRPVNSVGLQAFRSPWPFVYSRWGDWASSGATDWQFPLCPLSMDLYGLSASGRDGLNGFAYVNFAASLPRILDIPASSIDGTYDTPLQMFKDITVNGSVDMIQGIWLEVCPGRWKRWIVSVDQRQRSVQRPMLPDSLLVMLGDPMSHMAPDVVRAYDYDTVRDLNGVIQILFKSAEPDYIEFNRMLNIYRFVDAAAAARGQMSPDAAQNLILDPLH